MIRSGYIFSMKNFKRSKSLKILFFMMVYIRMCKVISEYCAFQMEGECFLN